MFEKNEIVKRAGHALARVIHSGNKKKVCIQYLITGNVIYSDAKYLTKCSPEEQEALQKEYPPP